MVIGVAQITAQVAQALTELTQASIFAAKVFDKLPETYLKALYEVKCELAYKHIYESCFGANQSVYSG
ncbi:MAG: hypothetical protein WBV94_21190 [Blastocatellia bacterium]